MYISDFWISESSTVYSRHEKTVTRYWTKNIQWVYIKYFQIVSNIHKSVSKYIYIHIYISICILYIDLNTENKKVNSEWPFKGQAEVPTSHLRRCKARTEGVVTGTGGKIPGTMVTFMGFLWDFYGFYGISMGFLWDFYDFYGI